MVGYQDLRQRHVAGLMAMMPEIVQCLRWSRRSPPVAGEPEKLGSSFPHPRSGRSAVEASGNTVNPRGFLGSRLSSARLAGLPE